MAASAPPRVDTRQSDLTWGLVVVVCARISRIGPLRLPPGRRRAALDGISGAPPRWLVADAPALHTVGERWLVVLH